MDGLLTFFGRFHPLIVHLPIGMLMLAFLMEVVSYKDEYKKLEVAIPFALLLGSLSAAAAGFLGYLLSFSGDYDIDMLWWHQWLGIGVSIIGFICFYLKTKSTKRNAMVSQSLLMMFLSFTGHLGGNLTHGETYLTEYAPWTKKKEKLPPPTSVDSAFVFQHVIQPILERKCVSCHNDGKRKGELRMNTPENLLKGGKHGAILVAGKMEESEIYKRVNLSPNDEEFMPPDGKTPLSEEEVTLLGWWIENANHAFDKKVGDFEASKDIQSLISNKLNLDNKNISAAGANLPEISLDVINELSEIGFTIRSLMGNYQLVDVTLNDLPPNISATNKDRLDRLLVIKSQIVWLNLSDQAVKDEDLNFLKDLTSLQRLRMENNPITDKGIKHCETLKSLESLNLNKTQVTKEVLSSLALIPNLKSTYLWGTSVKKQNVKAFIEQYPDLNLVLGSSK